MNKSYGILTLSIVAMAAITLSGCSKKPIIIPPPAPQTGISAEQHQCAASCLNTRSSCLKQQNKIYQQCSFNAKKNANLSYDSYVTQQLNAKKEIKLSPKSFLNLTSCQKQLTCAHDYANCFQACGL